MTFRIGRIWLMWLAAMLLLAAIAWLSMLIAVPGGSSGTPAPRDIAGFFAHIGVFGTLKVIGFLIAPPVVFTWAEARRARRAREP